MPDTSLNWKNLRDHLRRYAVVYVVSIVVAAVLADLLWTVTTPRVPEDRRVVVYLAGPWSQPETLDPLAEALLKQGRDFDPTLQEVVFESLFFADPEADYTGPIVLTARLASGESDLFLASPEAMDALILYGACAPLDDRYAAGWLAGSGLEPLFADCPDPETGEERRMLAGFRLDALNALRELGAFENQGATLCVAANSANPETAVRVAELLVEALSKESNVDA